MDDHVLASACPPPANVLARDPPGLVEITTAHVVARRKVTIHHPGYNDDATNILFSLPSTDCINGHFGVHFGTVYTACVLIAANRHGWLSRLGDKTNVSIALHEDELLKTGAYYFHVGGFTEGKTAQNVHTCTRKC